MFNREKVFLAVILFYFDASYLFRLLSSIYTDKIRYDPAGVCVEISTSLFCDLIPIGLIAYIHFRNFSD